MQDDPLANKVALITGGARRIGAAIARCLHAQGLRLIVHYRSAEREAHALQQELNDQRADSVILVRGDLLEVKKLANLVQEAIGAFDRLDVVINNASAFYPTSLGDTDEKQWQELMGTNLKAPYFLIQSAARELRQRHGCVVNMVDIYGQRPLAEHPVYCAAKAGLIMLTKALAVELAPEVRVNAVAPGAILWPEHNHDEVAQQRLVSQTPLRRIGTTEEVTAAVLFLLRDARFTTGHVIPVDGGRTILS